MFHICFLCQTACFSLRPICHLPFGQSATCPSANLPLALRPIVHVLLFFINWISFMYTFHICFLCQTACVPQPHVVMRKCYLFGLVRFPNSLDSQEGRRTWLVWFGLAKMGRAQASPCFFFFVDFGLWIISDCVRSMPMLVPNQTMPHYMNYFVIDCPEPNQPRTILQATKHGLRASYTKPNQTILHISH